MKEVYFKNKILKKYFSFILEEARMVEKNISNSLLVYLESYIQILKTKYKKERII